MGHSLAGGGKGLKNWHFAMANKSIYPSGGRGYEISISGFFIMAPQKVRARITLDDVIM